MEVRAQAAKCLSNSLSPPAAFHFLFQKVAKYWLKYWLGEEDGQGGHVCEDSLYPTAIELWQKKKVDIFIYDSVMWMQVNQSGKRAEDGAVGALGSNWEQLRATESALECQANTGQGR